MDGNNDPNVDLTRGFIDHCKEKFGWGDLSSDVIMDIGCGVEGYCAKAILDKFPQVEAIIALDKNLMALRMLESKCEAKIHCEHADIERKETLQCYAGKMSKVISTHVIYLVKEKEESFRNMYHLLKPGGEAAVLCCVKFVIDDWLTELLNNPRWKEAYQHGKKENLFKTKFRADYYKEIVQKIGFEVIECSEEEVKIPHSSDEVCKEDLYEMCGDYFKVPIEMLEDFKKDCFQVLLKVSARNEDGEPCYSSTFLSLLLVKPTEVACSKTKENPVS